MEDKWENCLLIEFEFYRNFTNYQTELNQLLKENDLTIHYPLTRYEEFRVFSYAPSVEDQVINRIEREEAIKGLLENGQKRIERLIKAMDQLDADESDILWYTEIEPDFMDTFKLARIYGFKSIRELTNAKQEALKKLYRIFIKDRREFQKEYKLLALEARRKIVSGTAIN